MKGALQSMACLVWAAAALFAAPLRAQTVDIRGVVRDSVNHETLPYALVTTAERHRAFTDEYGRFALVNLRPGTHVLRVEYLSYRTKEVEVAVPREGPLTIDLSAQAIELEGLTVDITTELVQPADEVSVVTVSPRKLNALPTLGETDVFRAIQLLPGVGGTNDATSGLYIRGGTPDENLVLLDGMTVYHVDHFFGVFSAFNADAIKEALRLRRP